MQRVLVIDKTKKALMPCHPARARELLTSGKAAVYRRFPFTIILKEREGGDVQPVALKIDPGSKTTGLALVADFKSGKQVVWGAELTHRGQSIRDALLSRSQQRRFRRQRHTRYRPSRFLNRAKPKGWLAPSLKSRLDNIWTWVVRLAWRRQMTLPDKHGFPRTQAKISSRAYGFKTGDLVKAIVPAGKYAGTHVGRVAIRNRPSFGLNGFDVHPKCLKTLHRSDGYSY